MNDFIIHYGIKGQKWGIRRFQEENGSYTAAGKERYRGKTNTSNTIGESQEKELNKTAYRYFYQKKRSKAQKDITISRDSDLAIRDAIFEHHSVIREDLDNHTYLVRDRNNSFQRRAVALIERDGNNVKISAIAEEGPFQKNRASKYIESIEKDINKYLLYLDAMAGVRESEIDENDSIALQTAFSYNPSKTGKKTKIGVYDVVEKKTKDGTWLVVDPYDSESKPSDPLPKDEVLKRAIQVDKLYGKLTKEKDLKDSYIKTVADNAYDRYVENMNYMKEEGYKVADTMSRKEFEKGLKIDMLYNNGNSIEITVNDSSNFFPGLFSIYANCSTGELLKEPVSYND